MPWPNCTLVTNNGNYPSYSFISISALHTVNTSKCKYLGRIKHYKLNLSTALNNIQQSKNSMRIRSDYREGEHFLETGFFNRGCNIRYTIYVSWRWLTLKQLYHIKGSRFIIFKYRYLNTKSIHIKKIRSFF